jgi:hypothetical protein
LRKGMLRRKKETGAQKCDASSGSDFAEHHMVLVSGSMTLAVQPDR